MTATTSTVADHLTAEFAATFPEVTTPVHLFHAPGRINLIGEHTDYNEGFVLPGAINFDVQIACAPNRSGQLQVRSLQEERTIVLPLDDFAPAPRHDWSDYVQGVQLQLARTGFKVPGASLLINGHVPMGAGLSSSAALEVATALALLDVCGSTLDGISLAQLCQRAENEFVGARCGIMDQFSSIHGRAGHALLLDCRSLHLDYVPVPADAALVVCNTNVKHSLASGEYNQRRAECEQCVNFFAQKKPETRSLRDVTQADLQQFGAALPKTLFRRARHVITENARVLRTAEALNSGDLDGVGALMYESHASLRDDYEVSCRELDIIVGLAKDINGVYGARMMGGGFGGCVIALVKHDLAGRFKTEIAGGYERATSIVPDIYVTTLCDGAGPVTNSSSCSI